MLRPFIVNISVLGYFPLYYIYIYRIDSIVGKFIKLNTKLYHIVANNEKQARTSKVNTTNALRHA